MSDPSETRCHHSQLRRQYKLKEENLVQDGVSRISLEGSSSRDGASREIAKGCEPGQSVAGKRKGALGQGLRWPKPWW